MRQLSLFEEVFREEKKTHWPVFEGGNGVQAVYDGHEVINFSSFDYLGLANNLRVIDSMRGALDKYGGELCAPRHSGGNTYLHQMLEEKLAEFKKVDAVLLFPSDISAAFALLSFMLSSQDLVVMDELSNKKIYKFTGANIKVFPHRDVSTAVSLIEGSDGNHKRIFLGESIFEVEGDVFPLNDLVELIKSHKMVLVVDDTNGLGVLGRNGRGIVDHFNLYGQIDIEIGSLSRALVSQVGYITGVKPLITYLIEHSPFFSLPIAPSPIAVASALGALDIMRADGPLIEKLWHNAKYFRTSLKQLGFDTGAGQTPIVPIVVSEDGVASLFSNHLFEKGIFIPYLIPPCVPQNKPRLRAIVTAVHTKDDLNRALDILEAVGKELGVIT